MFGERFAIDRLAAAHAPRISAAAMPSSIDSASSRVAGARRNVMSLKTSTSTPPRPNATSLPKRRSVTAPTITSWPPASFCCTWMPTIVGVGLILLRVCEDLFVGVLRGFGAVHADDHAARFGLVQDLRRDDLHHDREADRVGELAPPRRPLRRRLLAGRGCRRRRRPAWLRAQSAHSRSSAFA